jgi:CYTH domain-containing protein
MIEKERKFILKHLPSDLYHMERIQQGYLMFDGNKHLRVRIIDDNIGFITIKTIVSDTTKIEYEYEIPLEDAIELMNSTDITLRKVRYKTLFDGNLVDIDIYENGLSVVEIEYQDQLNNIPDYCGKEITGKKKYSNIRIAKKTRI